MFDIGFWEMAVIGVIALLVIGPERLPAVARNVGRWVGTARRYVSHVKSDIERELHADEMRELLEQPEGLESIRDVARDTAAVFEDTRKELNSIANDAESGDGASSASSDDDNAERLAPHHAVDEDPFASSSSMSSAARDAAATESPTESGADSWTESLSDSSEQSSSDQSSSDHSPSDNSDRATTTDSTNEQRTGQPEQR